VLGSFASDNRSGAHPEVMAALAAANDLGHVVSYGHDPLTARARELLAAELGERPQTFFVLNGSAANVLALDALLAPFESVLTAASAHVYNDEAGAVERFVGARVVPVPTPDGKLTPALVEAQLGRLGDPLAVQPGVVSIAQPTELGTCYSLDELAALADCAHARGLRLHVDGARIANAVAALGVSLAEHAAHADALTIGVTKNGGVGAEVVVLTDPEPAARFPWRQKQGLQTSSKMRFVAAQVVAMHADGLWLRSAAHANAMARRLTDAVGDLPGLEIAQAVESNAVFARLSRAAIEALQADWAFYVWDEPMDEVRWMCSWDTAPEQVDAFARAIAAATS
jgi:threonine aldolase